MSTSEQIRQFVHCIYGHDDWIELRALNNGDARKLWRPADGLVESITHLEALNRNGWDIYAGANPRKDTGLSGDRNVAACRALFADFDNIEPGDGLSPSGIALTLIGDLGLPAPTLVVCSGHGVHCYWRLTEPIAPDQWRGVQERLNGYLGSDPTIKNPERIMRLPGFQNLKAEPVDCFIVSAEPDSVYDLTDIESQLPMVAQPVQVEHKPDGYLERRARAMLYASRWDSCTEGQRNDAAYRHSAQMLRDFELLDDDAWEILAEWNQRNDPPLDEQELHTAFEDANKYGKGPYGSKLRLTVPPTIESSDPAAELESLIDGEISGQYTNVEWPWPMLTDFGQCLTPGTRTVVVGTIGGGKSLFMLQAVSQWVEAGIPVAILELERKRDFHLKRLLAQRIGIADVTKSKWVRQNASFVQALVKEHRDYLNRVGVAIHSAGRQFTSDQAVTWIEQRADEGCRIICIDPVTALARGQAIWTADEAFMTRAEKVAASSGASLVFVTHAKKGASKTPDMDSLAGATAWARFADAILWLQRHNPVTATVKTSFGTGDVSYNRTLHMLKTRSGEGTGCRLAYNFEADLTLTELGIIVRQKKTEEQTHAGADRNCQIIRYPGG